LPEQRSYALIQPFVEAAFVARQSAAAFEPQAAQRLFNGFYEGCPELLIDRFASTLVLYGYARPEGANQPLLDEAQQFLLARLPWVGCVVQKTRFSARPELRRGRVTFGGQPAAWVQEGGVRYALDLLMQQDTSFYLDTRPLRQWLLQNAAGWRVLNTFAYTGSLGVAALAGGASQVIQTDRSRKFLELARRSASLNDLPAGRMRLLAGDFFSQVASFKRQGALFDCVLLDPPFFSSTSKGQVDLQKESLPLINKLRPLVADGGWLAVVNNALFLSGAAYLAQLERLCEDGYLSIADLLPVPQEITGFPETITTPPPVDPAPFNHPTKMALLKVRRKQV
jgi:23S rRNA (cytosine1962-C5)-methyltransferase